MKRPDQKYHTFLFDFDGTVLDTNELVFQSFQHTYQVLTGHPGDPAEILPTYGEKLDDILARFFPETPVEESLSIYRGYQARHSQDSITLFPGILETIDQLRDRGMKMALVTSRHWTTAKQYLDQFDLFDRFQAVITERSTKAHKPDPAPILKALQELDAPREGALMIGDSKNDRRCAKNAGVDFALVSWALAMDPSADHGEDAPDLILQRAEDLLDLAE